MRLGGPPGISFRTGTERDLSECSRIWREGIDAYLLPTTPMTAFPIDEDQDRDETPGLNG